MKTDDIERLLGILRNLYWTAKADDEPMHIFGSRRGDVPMPTLGDLRGLVKLAQELAHVKTTDSLPPLRVFVWVRRKGQGDFEGQRDRMILVEQPDGTTRPEWAMDAIYPDRPVEEWTFFCRSEPRGNQK